MGVYFSEMGRRCVVGECSSDDTHGYSLFKMPRGEARNHWDTFIKRTRVDWGPGFGSQSTVVCALHFQLQDFENYAAWRLQGNKYLYIKKGAIPSLKKSQIKDDHRNALRKPGHKIPTEQG